MDVTQTAKAIAYSAPDIVVVSAVVEYGYSFSDPIRDNEQNWD